MAVKDCERSDKDSLRKCMELKGFELLEVFKINGKYIIGIYQGSLSKHDILIKYRQKEKSGKWSRIRTPKHIHWAVDILMKMQTEPELIRSFLSFLIKQWEKVEPIKDEKEKKVRLSLDYILAKYKNELNSYKKLSGKGEYSVKFLIVLAELLMIQEKTNREDAYMFGKLLRALEEGEDIFKIVSIATHTGR
ncbi:hypothetical protein [Persephonella sp.]